MAERGAHSLRSTVRLTTSFVTHRRRRLAILAVTATVSGFAEAAALVILARLAFGLASESDLVPVRLGPFGRAELEFGVFAAIAAALVLLRGGLQVVSARLSSSLTTSVQADTRRKLLAGYLGSSWALQSAERTGRLQEVVSSFSISAGACVSLLASTMVSAFSLLAFVTTAFFVNALAAIVVVLAGVIMALSLRPIRRRVRYRSQKSNEATLDLATGISEIADGMLAVRVFDVEGPVSERVRRRIDTSAAADRRLRNLMAMGPTLYQTAALLLVVLSLVVIAVTDLTRLGAIGGVVLVMIRSLSYAQMLQNSYQQFHSAAPALELVRAEIARYEREAVDRGGESFEHIGTITFEHVWFRYAPGDHTLLDVSFRVPPGEIVGILGPSGAGKSTLVQLLLRLRVPDEGLILVDGRDVQGLSLTDWYRRMAFVPQEPWLFSGTVAENIAFFRDDVTPEMVSRAARQANLHEEIMALGQGYDAPVGERGGQLSGGQRQRLCIARALVEQPDVLVLDEPTSALDVQAETMIRATLASLAPRTTIFVIAHRLSTLEICDRIMVLRDGRLEGFDAPDALASSNPFYREALELSGLV
jgi:ABC-type multidrug transport system fused ATPase/permease subunit